MYLVNNHFYLDYFNLIQLIFYTFLQKFTEWMVILDMDTIVSEELASSMIQLCRAPKGSCFKFLFSINIYK